MNKKKILIVANGLSGMGGIGNALFNMICEIYHLENDIDLELMLFDYESGNCVKGLPCKIIKAEYKYSLNISIKELIKKVIQGKMPISFLYHRFLYKLHYTLPLIDDIANSVVHLDSEYDLAIAYNCIPSHITNYVANNVKATRKVVWAHTNISQKNRKNYGRKSILWINGLYKYDKTLLKYNKIYAVSNMVKESILHEINDSLPIEVFHNFTNKDYVVAKANEPSDCLFSNKCINLLTVGRLSFEKGIKLALKTANLLRKDGYQFKWYFLGDISEKKYIDRCLRRNKLSNYIVLKGLVDNPYPYYKKCDIYVHTSYSEGFCTAINEAKMLGKPIVATEVSGIEEQIIDGLNGLIAGHTSINIYNEIKKLINDLCLRKSFALYNETLLFNNEESFKKLKELLDY